MWKRLLLNRKIILVFFTLVVIFIDPGASVAENRITDISHYAVPENLSESNNITESNNISVLFEEDKVLEVMDQKAGLEGLSYNLNHGIDRMSLKISLNFVNAMIKRKISLTIGTSIGKFLIDPAVLDLRFLQQPGTDPGKAKIRVTIGKAGVEQDAKIEGFFMNHGMTMLVNPVEFTTEALIDSRSIKAVDLTNYVSYKIVLPRSVDARRTIGVVFDKNGSCRPVPTRFLTENNKEIAVLITRGQGIFTLIRNDITFADVSTHWARTDIDILASKLIVSGVGNDSFVPGDKVTRAQVASLLARALMLEPTAGLGGFRDLKKSDWYYGSVLSAVESGIIRGYPNGVFNPQKLVTREEVAVIAAKALAFCGAEIVVDASEAESVLERFKDHDKISPWARPGTAIAVKSGIMTGTGSGIIGPRATCTRAEFVVMLRRTLVNAGLISPSVILVSPAEDLYTNKGTVEVRGKARPGNEISLEKGKLNCGEDGSFESSLHLDLGTNTFGLTDVDAAGNVEKIVRTVVYDISPPSLIVDSPEDKDIVADSSVIVRGAAEEGCVVIINDSAAAVNAKGEFSGTAELELGRNVLDIAAVDRAGNETHARRVVYCSPNKISGFKILPEPVKLGSMVNIRYLLEQDAYVSVEVFRENGDKVRTIQQNMLLISGVRTGSWDGKDSKGALVPDGKYRFVAVVRDLEGKEIGRTEKTVVAARVPVVEVDTNGDTDELPVFAPTENEGVTLTYAVQANSKVTITVLKGRLPVATLAEDIDVQPGTHSIIWDGKDETGNFSGDGIYTCVISAVSAEASQFKTKSELRFIIERESPKILNFVVNPNPFKINVSGLNIRYNLSEEAKVNIKILGRDGRQVVWLIRDVLQESGRKVITWNGTDDNGQFVPEGTYQVTISAVDNFRKESELLVQTITAGYKPFISDIKFKPDPFYADGTNSAYINFNLLTDAVITVEIKVQWVTVKTILVDSSQKAGCKSIRWDGSDNSGYLAGEGRYDLVITAVSPTVPSLKNSYAMSFDVKENSR